MSSYLKTDAQTWQARASNPSGKGYDILGPNAARSNGAADSKHGDSSDTEDSGDEDERYEGVGDQGLSKDGDDRKVEAHRVQLNSICSCWNGLTDQSFATEPGT